VWEGFGRLSRNTQRRAQLAKPSGERLRVRAHFTVPSLPHVMHDSRRAWCAFVFLQRGPRRAAPRRARSVWRALPRAGGLRRCAGMEIDDDPTARVRSRRYRNMVDELLPKLCRLSPQWSDDTYSRRPSRWPSSGYSTRRSGSESHTDMEAETSARRRTTRPPARALRLWKRLRWVHAGAVRNEHLSGSGVSESPRRPTVNAIPQNAVPAGHAERPLLAVRDAELRSHDHRVAVVAAGAIENPAPEPKSFALHRSRWRRS